MNMKALSICLALLFWVSIGGCPTEPSGDDDGVDNGPVIGDDDSGDTGDDNAGDDAGDDNDDGADDADDDDGDDGDVDDDPEDPNESPDPNDAEDPNEPVDPNDPNDPNDPSDPNDPNDPNATGSILASDTFTGELTCNITTWDDLTNTTDEKVETRDISIAFDESGVPESFTIPGYLFEYDWFADVANVGDSVTLNHTDGGYEVTLIVTVAAASYTATTGQVALNLDHYGENGSRIEDGVGLHAIQYELDGDSLTYTVQTAYEIEWTAPLVIQTTQDFDCSGVLTRQP